MGLIIKKLDLPIVLEGDMKDGEAILPGMLVEEDGVEFQKHATADGVCEVMVALENQGGNKDIDTAYANGDNMQVVVKPAMFSGILATSQTIAKGDPLVSNGAGLLKAAAAVTATQPLQSIVGYANEAVTTTGATARITVRTR